MIYIDTVFFATANYEDGWMVANFKDE